MYDTQTHTTNTNTVVALAQAETEAKLELQVGARLTDFPSICNLMSPECIMNVT